MDSKQKSLKESFREYKEKNQSLRNSSIDNTNHYKKNN
jgi:hypothetical protein